MADPYFGHRVPGEKEPVRDRDEWSDWDYLLISALQIIEDNTDQHGILRWVSEAEDRVDIAADRKIDRFQEAVDLKTKGTKKKPYDPRPGERFVPSFHLRSKEWPTWREYVQKLQEEAGRENS